MKNTSGYWKRRWFKTMCASVFLLAVIFLVPDAWSQPFRFTLTVIAQPIERVTSFVGFKLHEVFSVFGSVGQFKEENARLLGENLRLQSENARLRDVDSENALLRAEMALPTRSTFDILRGEIIGRDAEGSGRWVLINRGRSDGLAAGMPVVVGDGILIGQLGEVYSTSARVTLLTHPESVINIVDEATGAQGVLRGAYGLGMTLDLIPQSDTLHTGDRVITSGLGGTLPRALVIGTIEDIHPTPDRLFQQASIKPAVSLDAARFVQIIRTFTPFQAQ